MSRELAPIPRRDLWEEAQQDWDETRQHFAAFASGPARLLLESHRTPENRLHPSEALPYIRTLEAHIMSFRMTIETLEQENHQ